MRLLFLLLWRNNFTLLFLILQVFCIYLLVQNNKFQNASVLNATNAGVAKAMEGVSYVQEYVHLRENNEGLATENAKLRTLLKDAAYDQDSSRILVNDSSRKQQYAYVTAKVINNSINRRNNYLTLNKGSVEGIKPEMGVITSSGVVGIVQQVSEHYCTVMSLLHNKTRISAMIQRNNFFGSLAWDGTDPSIATLNEIDKTVPVQKGDTIVTTSYSSIFPAGIMIGKVEEARLKPGSNFHEIRIKLSTRFDNLSYVYIVDNLLKNEQRNLETKSETE
ncbi:rod shape-determining protein MreC [soil metagenome]